VDKIPFPLEAVMVAAQRIKSLRTPDKKWRVGALDEILLELEKLSVSFQACKHFDVVLYYGYVAGVETLITECTDPLLMRAFYDRVIRDTLAATNALPFRINPNDEAYKKISDLINETRAALPT